MSNHLQNELLSQAETISNFGIWELDLTNNSVQWSDGVFRICGYEPQEFEVNYEKNLNIIHPDDRDFTKEQVQNTIATGKEFDVRKRFITKQGTIKYINSKGKLIRGNKGNAIKLRGVYQDITETIELETALKKTTSDLKALIENTPDIIYSIDLNYKLINYNSAFENVVNQLGLGQIDKGVDVFTLYSAHKRELYSAVFLIVKQGQRYVFEDELLINGITNYFDVSVNPIINQNKEVIGVSVFSKDITNKKSQEKELDRIKANQEALINGTSDIIWSINTNFELITANTAFYEAIKAFIGQRIKPGDSLIFQPDNENEGLFSMWIDLFKRGLNGESFTFDYFDEFQGYPNYSSISFSPMFNDKHEVWGVACYSKNITKEKLSFLEIEKKEAELQKIMDSSMDIICTIDEKGNFTKVSSAAEKIWGYKPEELQGKPYMNLVYPEDHEKTIEAAKNIIAGISTTSFENRYVAKNGKLVPIIWSVLWDETDKLNYCIAKDATEIKKKEEELKRTNEVLKNAQKLAKIGNYELNLNTNEVFCSDEIYNICEIDRNENKILSPKNFFSLTHPDDAAILDNFRKQIIETGGVDTILHRIITKKNKLKYVRQVVELVYDEKTDTKWLYGTLRDSTANILAQNDIEISREKYRYLFDNNPSPMFIFDFETLKIIDCNNEALELYGYTKNEFLNLTIRDIRPPEDIPLINKATSNEEAYGQIHKDTWRHQKKNGEIMYVNINGHLIDFDSKRSSLVQVTDLTEKLKADLAIKASELQKELIMNAALDAIICINKKGEVTFWNPQAEHIFGWKDGEVVGKNLTNLIVPNVHRNAHDAGMKHYLKTKEGPVLNKLLELTAINKDGLEFPIELTVIPIQQGDDEFFCSFIRDISTRKKSEQLILESEVKYRTMIECSMDAILLTVKNGQILSLNEAACQIFQMTHEEVIAAGRNGLVDLSDPRLIPLLEEREKFGKVRGELTFKRKDGSKFPGEITSVVFNDANGQERTSMVIRDISAQKKAEKEILESNQRYDYATKATFDSIWDWNFETDTIYWGEGLSNIFGYQLPNNISNIEFWTQNIHPDDYERVSNSINLFIENKNSQINWIEEYQLLKADGTYAFVLDRGLLIKNEKNEVIRMVGAIQDITKKKQEDLRLKLLESVVTNTNDAVLITEAELIDGSSPRILYVNEAFTRMTGYTSEEVIGKTPKILQGPKSDRKELQRLVKALKNWESCELTTVNYKKNGDEFYVNFSVTPVANADGWYTHWVALERDVTDSVIAQQQLLASYDERNTILESIDDGFFATDKNFIVTYWNKRAEELLGELKKNVVGQNLFKMFANPDSMAFHDYYQKAIKENRTIHFEEYSVRSKKWFEVSAFASDKGLSVYFKDITDKKFIEEQIKSERNLLRTLIDNIPDAIYVKDEKARKIISSKIDYNLIGFKTEEDVIGKTDLELFKNELGEIGYNHDLEIINNGISLINYEQYFEKNDGKPLWLLTTKVPLRNNENKIIGLLGIGRNITDIKIAQQNIQNVNIELEKNIKQLKISNQELEQFAYVASHDLQEPLRMITSFLTQIEKKYNDILDERGKQYIYFAVDGAKRMRQIILDILEFSRVGRQTENLEEVDINELIKDIETLYKKQITEESASIICGDFPKIYSYRIPIRQVLQNLISNALKYHQPTKPCKLNIDVLEDKTNWIFSVKDNGIGIDKEYHEKIFIIFQRLHNKDEYTGTGLGLAICKKIIENLGGEIWVENNKEEGSCFYFTIPKSKVLN